MANQRKRDGREWRCNLLVGCQPVVIPPSVRPGLPSFTSSTTILLLLDANEDWRIGSASDIDRLGTFARCCCCYCRRLVEFSRRRSRNVVSLCLFGHRFRGRCSPVIFVIQRRSSNDRHRDNTTMMHTAKRERFVASRSSLYETASLRSPFLSLLFPRGVSRPVRILDTIDRRHPTGRATARGSLH